MIISTYDIFRTEHTRSGAEVAHRPGDDGFATTGAKRRPRVRITSVLTFVLTFFIHSKFNESPFLTFKLKTTMATTTHFLFLCSPIFFYLPPQTTYKSTFPSTGCPFPLNLTPQTTYKALFPLQVVHEIDSIFLTSYHIIFSLLISR